MVLKKIESSERFNKRIENYSKYRPDYPVEVIAYLNSQGLLSVDSTVADIGSGTGIFTKLLLDYGNTVYAIEPNEEMRQNAENKLSLYPKFNSIDGTGEKTNISSQSIDAIFLAQSFHWLDRTKARKEFEFSNSQSLDFEGLLGRLASSSYMPNENHERYDEMHNELKILFKKYCINKKVKIIYNLILYWGDFS